MMMLTEMARLCLLMLMLFAALAIIVMLFDFDDGYEAGVRG